MADKCIRLNRPTSNAESELYKYIYNNIVKEENKANELFAYFSTQDFIDDFGDWIGDYKIRTDNKQFKEDDDYEEQSTRVGANRIIIDTGEPKLFYNKEEDYHYYVSKHGYERPFPKKTKGLETIFNSTEVINITKALAFNYVNSNLGDNFQELNFNDVGELLDSSVSNKLNEVITRLRSSEYEEDGILAEQLNDSLLYKEEWTENVKNYFQSIKLVYKEDDSESIEQIEENPKDPNFSKSSFEQSTKDSISANVKLRLSILQDVDENGVPNTVDEVLGEPVFIPFNAIYSVLLSRLNNKVPLIKEEGIENMFDIFLAEIENLSIRKPYLKALVRQLKGENEQGEKVFEVDPNIKNEFVQAFNLHKNNFLSLEVDKKDSGTSITVKDISNAGAKFRTIHSDWDAAFKANYANGTQYGTGAKNYKLLKENGQGLKEFQQLFKDAYREGRFKEEGDLDNAIGTFRAYLDNLHIPVTEKAVDLFLDGNELEPTSTDERAIKLNTAINDLTRFVNDIVNLKHDPTKGNALDYQTMFNELAQAEAFFVSEETDATVYSAGKTKWLFSNPTYLSTRIKVWKKNPELLYSILDTEYGKSSLFAKHLLALDVAENVREKTRKARLDNFDIAVFNTFQERNKPGRKSNEAVDNKSIAINDFTATYANNVLQTDSKGKNLPYYYTPTPADKGSHLLVKLDHFVDTNANYNANTDSFEVDQKVYDIFLDYFASEYARIAKVQKEIDTKDPRQLTQHYHIGRKNGLKSQLFPTLSPDKFDANKSKFSFRLYDGGKPAVKDLRTLVYTERDIEKFNLDPDLKGKNKIVEEFIKPLIAEKIKGAYKNFYAKNIFERATDGSIIAHGIDESIVNRYKEKSPKQYGLKIASDTLINGIIAQVEYSKMFSGDVAFYKDPVDYKKRIPATYTDGLQLTLKPGEEYFKASIIDSVEVSTPYLSKLKKMLPKSIWKHYAAGINAADAQAWITPQRWRFLMESLGKWNSSYESVYNKIMSGKNEALTESELKKVAQPLKGVYFDINSGNTPVYLKYSQAVLIPQLVKNTPLQKIYDKMIAGTKGLDNKSDNSDFNKQIHEVITIDGAKVGAIRPVRTHNDDGTMMEDFDLTSYSLKNTGWKLQQDLPTKTVKPTAVGTQLQKNIFAGLANNPDKIFKVGDTEMTGIELYHHLNNIVKSLSDKGKGSLIDEFGIRTGNKIGNYKRVYQAMIDELKSRGGSKDVISALERGLTPYGIPQAKKTLMNIFSSIFLKKLVKIKTNGGSFVQLSNYGISKPENVDEDAPSDGIIWSPALAGNETPFEPHYLEDADGNIIKDDKGNPTIRPGGILISGSFIAKYIPDYRSYSPKQLFGEYNKETGKYEAYEDANGVTVQPKIDNDILQGIIGYRIPNQGLASNDSLQIVGILPETEGDTVVAYTGITTKTGSDFDIDKMYMMLPSFTPYRGSKNLVTKYIVNEYQGESFRETVDNIKEALKGIPVDFPVTEVASAIVSKKKENRSTIISDFVEAVLEVPADQDNALTREIKSLAKDDPVTQLRYVKPKKDTSIELQDSKALNNMLIESYKAVLTHPDVISDIMTPIDFDFVKNHVNTLFTPEDAGDLGAFDPYNDITLKYEFIAGKAGVGQEANALVDHNRGRMADTYFHRYYLGRGSYKMVEGDKSTTLDKESSEVISKADLNLYLEQLNELRAADNKEPLEFKDVADLASVKIADSLSAVLNAFVDIAKDPYITRGNWTTQTTNTGNMLLRAGFHPFYVNAFLGQPILKEYVQYVTNKESKITGDTGNLKDKFRIDKVKEHLDKRTEGRNQYTIGNITKDLSTIYGSLVKKGPNMDVYNNLGRDTSLVKLDFKGVAKLFNITEENISSDLQAELENLIDEIKVQHRAVFFVDKLDVSKLTLKQLTDQIKGKENTTTQLSILDTFYEWQDQTKQVGQSINGSKLDVSGYGKSIGELIITDNIINKLLKEDKLVKDFVGFDEKLIKDGNLTLLGAYKRNIIDWTKDVMQANPLMFFESQQYVINTFNEVAKDVTEDLLTDEKLAKTLEEEYYTYLLSGFKPLIMSKEERVNLLTDFVDDFIAFKEENQEDLKFLQYVSVENIDGRNYLNMTNRDKDPELENELIAGWKFLLNTPELKEYGENLIKYAYLTSGFKMSTTQFFTLIPSDWFIERRIDNYLADSANKMNQFNHTEKHDGRFIDQLYRSNFDNGRLVPNVFPSQIERVNIKGIKDSGVTGFELVEEGRARRFVKFSPKKNVTNLYKLIGYNSVDKGIYIKVSKLGTKLGRKYPFTEYLYNENIEESMVSANDITINETVEKELRSRRVNDVTMFDPNIETGTVDLTDKVDEENFNKIDKSLDC